MLPSIRGCFQTPRKAGMKVLWYQLLLHKCLTPHISHDTRPGGVQLTCCSSQHHSILTREAQMVTLRYVGTRQKKLK